MQFRDSLNNIKSIDKESSINLEIPKLLNKEEPNPLLFSKVKESPFSVAGNVFATRDSVAYSLGIKKEELVPKILNAIENPSDPKLIQDAPILENSISPDLSKIPVPFYLPKDGGPYFTSAVVFAHDKKYGRNLSFHRMMVTGKDTLTARILPRHFNEFIERNEKIKFTFALGLPIQVLLAASTSVDIGVDEMKIANSISPVQTVKLSNGTEIPADAEFAFEAELTGKREDEGPFLDLTGTYDIVRKEREFKITKIYHRNNPVFHALLPGGMEHKILMGMPREPTIFREVNKVCTCKDVCLTIGGCSWLHAVISIKKNKESDGMNAIEASFKGHKSLKYALIVDDDIDPSNSEEVEWAMATRVQADKSVVIKSNEKGSSLDPSADPVSRKTAKMGIDATKPLGRKKEFERIKY